MRLLLLQSSPYLPSLGGANKANRLLLEALAARGHDCHAIGTSGTGGTSGGRGAAEGWLAEVAEVAELAACGVTGAAPLPDAPGVIGFRAAAVGAETVFDRARLREHGARRLRELAPDWVLVSSEDPAQILLEVALAACPGRVVYLAHTTLHLPFGPDGFLASPAKTALLHRTAGIIAVSGFVQDYLRRWAGLDSTVLRFPVYGPGPFPALGSFDRGAVMMINPCAVKGISIFLELARRFPDLPFAAVPTWGTTEEDRAALTALPNVRLLPPSPRIGEVFAAARALVVPSLWGEAFGQVAVEAMLHGIPVLASDAGGLPEAKLGVPYVLPVRPIERYRQALDDRKIPLAEVPEQDVAPWASALASLLGDRAAYERLAAESRQAAAAFVAGLGAEPFERYFAGLAAAPVLAETAAARPATTGGGLRQKLDRLSPERMELLRRRLQREPAAGGTEAARGAAAIPRQPRRGADGEEAFALSFAQERIWFLYRFDPESAVYNEYFAARLEGRLQATALEASLDRVVRRHEILRTRYTDVDGRSLQVILPPAALILPRIDLAALPLAMRESEADRVAEAEGRRPFDLARGPVLRSSLLRLAEREHRLVVAIHHIAADHWAIAVAVRELSASYRAFVAGEAPVLPELPIQYADFAVWQREWLSGGGLDSQLAFWRGALAGAPALLDLPTDRPRPALQGAAGAGAWMRLPRPLAAALKALARQEDATLYMLLLAAFTTLLYRLTGDEDLVVGTPVAGRGRRETEPLIGFFLNVLPLRGHPAADLPFRGFLERTRKTALAAFAHQDLPFEKLVEELAPVRALSHTPIFQVMLNLQNTPHHAFELGDLRLTPVPVELGATKFDLNLYLEEDDEALFGHLVYATDLFDAGTAARWLGHFETLLAALAAAPDQRLSALPFLAPAELHQLTEWNDTAVPRAAGRGLHQLVLAQAARTPETVALTFEAGNLSYGELRRRAAGLAAQLRRMGIGAEQRVGIAMERSLELLPVLLGVLEAGAAYLPLDPEYPAERLAAMLGDARPAALLAPLYLLPDLPAVDCPVIAVEAEERLPSGAPAASAEPVDGGQLAYVIYTSGSTGTPKGAMVQHEAIVNRILWMQEAYGLEPQDVVLQKTPLSFDVSVWELFWPLAAGARMVLARPGGHRDGAYLTGLIARERVSVLHFVPSMLQLFLEEPGLAAASAALPALPRLIVASGEALAPELAHRCRERLPASRLENLYGPTEAAVDVTAWSYGVDAGRAVPIGRPIANVSIHLLDRGGRPVPVGVTGELYIGGANVGRGYLDRPGQTAERFVPDPFPASPGGRLYRTGDLARRRTGGEIEFLGRTDHQVKVRGFRVELGEIETVLGEHPGVDAAVVVTYGAVGETGLAAYIVPARAVVPTTLELQEHLRRRLPAHMVPGLFAALPALPLSQSGKVDRRALPDPVAGRLAAGVLFAPPATALEIEIAALWSEALRIPVAQIGLHDSFFSLGGHSLLATRLLARYRAAFGVELPLRRLFEAATVGELARVVSAAQAALAAAPVPALPAAPALRRRSREGFRVNPELLDHARTGKRS